MANSKDQPRQQKHVKYIDGMPKGSEVLGYGYNVFGEYGTVDSMKSSLIKWDDNENKPSAKLDDVVSEISTERDHVDEYEGQSETEYISNLTAKIGLKGSYKFFKGEATASVKSEEEEKEEEYYYTLKEVINVRIYKLNTNQLLKAMLRIEVREALNQALSSQKNAFDFFDTYGTHYVSGIKVGGSLTLETRTEKSEGLKMSEIKATVKASVKTIMTKSEVEASATDKESSKEIRQSMSKKWTIQGGAFRCMFLIFIQGQEKNRE